VADGNLSRSRALKTVFAAIFGGLFATFALPRREAEARLPKTLWVAVTPDGQVVSKSRGVQNCIKRQPPGGRAAGEYVVSFSRNVVSCAKTATIGYSDDSIAASGEVVVSRAFRDSEVSVWTQNSSGAALDQPFQLVVNC
jgi:hypothetical protein